MAQQSHRAQEVNYINNIGAWKDESFSGNLSTIANSSVIEKRETITDDTVALLENYLYWAPYRVWTFGDWRFFYNVASARLDRVKKVLAAKEKRQAGNSKNETQK